MHVVNGVQAERIVPSGARWAVPEYPRHVIDDARGRLEASVPLRVRTAANVQLDVVTGVPHQAILDYASGVNADLVVVGASARFMHLGSATARVLRGSDRPLFVVPLGATFDARLRRTARTADSPRDDIKHYWNRRKLVRELILAFVSAGIPPIVAVSIVAMWLTGDWRAIGLMILSVDHRNGPGRLFPLANQVAESDCWGTR